ncbi:MAG: Wzt carbohydrate-binding domain-containing protein, partial [Anaerolineae bacterium]|nr:Wzt carbohydrate-binding domain-containing protein [Anaerolineae bacterium]
ISQMVMLDDSNQITDNIRLGESLHFRLTLQTSVYQSDLDVVIRIETTDNISVTTVRSSDYQKWYSISPNKTLTISCIIPQLFLEPGEYFITLFVRNKQRHIHDHLPRIYRFHVTNTPYDIHSPPMAFMGVVTAHSQWETGDE